MGELVYVYGKSGSGKSRSLLNFAEDEIFLINTIGKRMPFPKKFKYELRPSNATQNTDITLIQDKLRSMAKIPLRAAVIDDAGYLMTTAFMAEHSKPKSGNGSFEMYNQIADRFWSLIQTVKWELPDDVIVYIMMHEEGNDFGEVKFRTIGKLLEQKVCLEGTSTIVLRCVCKDKQHKFVTQTVSGDVSKSPEGMFDELEIDNDLKAVDTRIREYWGLKPLKEKGTKKNGSDSAGKS